MLACKTDAIGEELRSRLRTELIYNESMKDDVSTDWFMKDFAYRVRTTGAYLWMLGSRMNFVLTTPA